MRYWRIGTRGDVSYWETMHINNKICIGWAELGDLRLKLPSSQYDVANLLNEEGFYPASQRTRTRKGGEIFNFYANIQEGDIVLAQDGFRVLGIGKVEGPYEYNSNAAFAHQKNVRWLIINPNYSNTVGNLTSVYPLIKEEKIKEIENIINPGLIDPTPIINKKIITMPLNQILYGPPGTGKTYNTINKALEVLDVDLAIKSRPELKKTFDEKVNLGQIVFTTFHQSMSYEDFIEGIKPVDPKIEGQPISYKVIDGIFKKACATAGYNCYKEFIKSKEPLKYSFDDLYDAFVDSIEKQLERKETPIFKTLTGKDVEIKEINRNNSIIARAKNSVAKVSAPLTKENLQKLYDKFKNITEIQDLQQVKDAVQVTPRITEFFAVFRGIKEFESIFVSNEALTTDKSLDEIVNFEEIQVKFNAGVFSEAVKMYGKNAEKVVLIIDEINRGNVSQIFGELITLIEDDKRLGKNESLEIVLPYSKKKFSVPENLYIIGTMNTADRSVEALDTALRRRFVFEEILPNSELLSPYYMLHRLWAKYWDARIPETEKWVIWEKAEADFQQLTGMEINEELYGMLADKYDGKLNDWLMSDPNKLFENICTFNGINLQDILSTINFRLEAISNTDYLVGHAYFINCTSITDLQNTFHKNVIPLLKEYYYGDFGKIGLILGEDFFEANEDRAVTQNKFAAFGTYDVDSFLEKPRYKLKDISKMDSETFKQALQKIA